jgi:predicted dehydrogenase
LNSDTSKKKINDLKGLVIGCGSIGERHIHNLRRIGLRHITICDTDAQKVDNLSLKYGTKKFYDLNSALNDEPDFSFVCTYPSSHLEIANKCISSKSHLFVEKPISSEINGVRKMLAKAQSSGLKVAVGYNIRFDPGLKLIKKKLENDSVSRPL